jgi:hypothetical protein
MLTLMECFRHDLLAAPGSGPPGPDRGPGTVSGLGGEGLSVEGAGVVLSSLRRRGDWLELRLACQHPFPTTAAVGGGVVAARAADLLAGPGRTCRSPAAPCGSTCGPGRSAPSQLRVDPGAGTGIPPAQDDPVPATYSRAREGPVTQRSSGSASRCPHAWAGAVARARARDRAWALGWEAAERQPSTPDAATSSSTGSGSPTSGGAATVVARSGPTGNGLTTVAILDKGRFGAMSIGATRGRPHHRRPLAACKSAAPRPQQHALVESRRAGGRRRPRGCRRPASYGVRRRRPVGGQGPGGPGRWRAAGRPGSAATRWTSRVRRTV